MNTIAVLAGNSDNKLTQEEWHNYCREVTDVINEKCTAVHFTGGSSFDSVWQNACWVAEVGPNTANQLTKDLAKIRENYRQSSIAVVSGDTDFI